MTFLKTNIFPSISSPKLLKLFSDVLSFISDLSHFNIKAEGNASFAESDAYIDTQKGIRNSNGKETARIAKQEAGRVLRQTAEALLFSLRVRACPPEDASFMVDSYPRPCLRLIFYAITRSLMKSLTAPDRA